MPPQTLTESCWTPEFERMDPTRGRVFQLDQQEYAVANMQARAADTLSQQATIEAMTLTCPRCEEAVTSARSADFVRVTLPAVEGFTSGVDWAPRYFHPTALGFRQADAVFTAPLFMTVVGGQGMSSGDALPTPVTFMFILPPYLEARPSTASVRRVGEFAEVELRSTAPVDPSEITVLSSYFGVDTSAVTFGVLRPELELSVTPRSIAGWGMEKASVTLSVANGFTSGTPAVLKATGGWLNETSLALQPGASAETELRSKGIGGGTVTATHPQFAPATIQVPYVWPLAFTVGAIVGTLLGFLAGFQLMKPKSGTNRRRFLGALGGGLGLSVMALVAGDVVPFTVPGPSWTHGVALGFIGSLFAYALVEKWLGLSSKEPADPPPNGPQG